jgi:hypothetical protein
MAAMFGWSGSPRHPFAATTKCRRSYEISWADRPGRTGAATGVSESEYTLEDLIEILLCLDDDSGQTCYSKGDSSHLP